MEKIKQNKNLIVCFFIAISFILMILSFFSSERYLSIISLMLLFCTLSLDAITNLKKNYLLLTFYITFFLFSMGQYIFPNNINWLYYTNYDLSTIKLTIFIEWIALFFTFLSFNIFSIFSKKTNKKSKNNSKTSFKFLILIMIILFILSCIVNLEISFRVTKYGYLVLYNNSVPSIFPSIFKYASSFFPIICFIILGNVKEKKYVYMTLILYFIYLCYTLLTGVRGEFGIGVLILIMYIFVYKFLIEHHSINYKKLIKIGICFLILIPILAIGLNILNYTRNNEEVGTFNALSQFQSFFVSQGSSVNLISMAIENEAQLKEKGTLYVFGPLLENIENKVIKIIPNFELDILNNKSTSFARDVSIIEIGEEGYNAGQGLGSQYLAELYVDYGYIGIILYSIILGIILYILSNFYKYGILGSSISLLLIQSVLYLPRGQAIQPVNAIFSFNFWIIIFLIYAFIKIKEYWKEK